MFIVNAIDTLIIITFYYCNYLSYLYDSDVNHSGLIFNLVNNFMKVIDSICRPFFLFWHLKDNHPKLKNMAFLNKKIILFNFLLIIYTPCNFIHAQVLNIDREIENDSTFKRIRASFQFNFSNDKQRRNLLDFSNTSEINYFLKNNYLFVFLSHTETAFNGLQVLENNGFFQLRYRDNDSRHVAPDFFTQYQWNGVQGMEHRALVGTNARFRWLEKKKSDLYTSIGVFYEYERWNPFLNSYAFAIDSIGIINRNIFRLNTSVKFALKLGKNIDFVGITYAQFPLNQFFLKPRWFLDSNLNFTVNKHLGFVIHYDHTLDTYRPLPIDDYYYSVSIGINLKF